jgi:hypothetical protein
LVEVDPGGFVYLPQLTPFNEKGPHLNEAQFNSILQRTRYHVWCSHHGHFYMESERFRNSALAGCLPVKVSSGPHDVHEELPFGYLLFDERDLTERLREMRFGETWDRFAGEYCTRQSLEQALMSLPCAQGRHERPVGDQVPPEDGSRREARERLKAAINGGTRG